ncbi:ATP-dependent endonuclease [Cryobacterium sp. TMB1-7]|uniref:ATP-dependent nuclease n=1 Tax=Cryobacterium sp. TMB1-7 TaxID=2555866 RepID=UPI00106B591C|nr:AAA family ATPase [Cryobacterium sp. TMB1-7]TFC63103.1 DUF2813 domain-containing protein [Cryobacterium sp. TMB1-7]
MHISKLSLVNYRNFPNAKLQFSEGINTVIGENGAGKSNLFRAIRLLLDREMIPSAYRMNAEDFYRGLTDHRGHWIVISMEFSNVSKAEAIQALFLHGVGVLDGSDIDRATYNLIYRPRQSVRRALSALSDGDTASLAAILADIGEEDYEIIFTGRSTVDFNDPKEYRRIVGDFETAVFNSETEFGELGVVLPKQLSVSREISFTFIKALRDVVSDFENGRSNPLRALLRHKSGEVDQDSFSAITSKVRDLNAAIEGWPDVQEVRTDIKQTLLDAVGEAYSPTSLSIKSALPDDADKLFQSLKLFVGEDNAHYEGGIAEMSLGGANLMYLTLKLLEFKYQNSRYPIANFLLIEEPEAHIHSHIQKTLFDRLSYASTQVIFSTHSPQISEVSNVKSMNILGRVNGKCEAFQPSSGLDAKEIRNVSRYLDAVRSNLLFARSVLLVEGDAEEILIPILIKTVLGIGLDELGISLINIRSTGFENVAILFDPVRIRKRCAIITDQDASIIDLVPTDEDTVKTRNFRIRSKRSQEAGVARATRLDAFVKDNPWVGVFYAAHTFEVDFADSGNVAILRRGVSDIYKLARTRDAVKSALSSKDPTTARWAALQLAEVEGKGWYAILLGEKIDEQVRIPGYILDALAFAHPLISDEMWYTILSYRLEVLDESDSYTVEARDEFRNTLETFGSSLITFRSLASAMTILFPEDSILDVLARY